MASCFHPVSLVNRVLLKPLTFSIMDCGCDIANTFHLARSLPPLCRSWLRSSPIWIVFLSTLRSPQDTCWGEKDKLLLIIHFQCFILDYQAHLSRHVCCSGCTIMSWEYICKQKREWDKQIIIIFYFIFFSKREVLFWGTHALSGLTLNVNKPQRGRQGLAGGKVVLSRQGHQLWFPHIHNVLLQTPRQSFSTSRS